MQESSNSSSLLSWVASPAAAAVLPTCLCPRLATVILPQLCKRGGWNFTTGTLPSAHVTRLASQSKSSRIPAYGNRVSTEAVVPTTRHGCRRLTASSGGRDMSCQTQHRELWDQLCHTHLCWAPPHALTLGVYV